ncbi:hypothetical protein DW228_06670 [Bacteroides fragilis]|uniref:Uncharacterized protein n=1 Tax=Bacteroides fragilis TaxID=817 RepID=A0A396C1L9_BACFG|nr:hypothetical protein [Bacteroides fragilis]RHH14478.1 hypothetical protein DW228_06670 [Bacteroides fragilis]
MKRLTSQIATSPNQAKYLITLGISPETADFRYESWNEFNDGSGKWSKPKLNIGFNPESSAFMGTCTNVIETPAWSLSQILHLLPKWVTNPTVDLILNIDFSFDISYRWRDNRDISNYVTFDKGDIFINACDALEWVIQQGFFNKGYLA